jgi:thermostable 8-oxoguanine DNA glycosylase
VERLFIFCQFDRVMPYEKVVASFDYLNKRGFASFDELRMLMPEDLAALFKEAKLRFPKVTADQMYYNIHHFDGEKLHKMSREEIVEKCKGFGWKLASMFCNRCQGTDYAIIDVHIDRYLKDHGCELKDYPGKEAYFRRIAASQGKTVDELDHEIWESSRVRRKKNNGN